MSLLKIKRFSQSCCLVFLFLSPSVAFSEYALYFDGNSRVDLGSSNWFPGAAYTIEASIKPSSSGLSYIISTAGMWGQNLSSLVIEDDSVSLYTRGFYETGTAYTASAVFPFDRFTYIAVTYNPYTQIAKIYINGVNVPVSFSVVPMPFPYTHSIGNLSSWSHSGYGFNGYIDAVVISHNEKSASEIADTALNGLDCNSSSVGCWLFEEGSGYIALDSSGKGLNGALVGTGGPSGYVAASAPGGSASSYAFGVSPPPSGVNVAMSSVGSASGLASGVGVVAIGAGSLLGILAAYKFASAVLGA